MAAFASYERYLSDSLQAFMRGFSQSITQWDYTVIKSVKVITEFAKQGALGQGQDEFLIWAPKKIAENNRELYLFQKELVKKQFDFYVQKMGKSDFDRIDELLAKEIFNNHLLLENPFEKQEVQKSLPTMRQALEDSQKLLFFQIANRFLAHKEEHFSFAEEVRFLRYGLRITYYKNQEELEHSFMSDPLDQQCDKCKKWRTTLHSLERCMRCKKVFYCDAKCQKSDWPLHRLLCQKNDSS